MAAKQYTAVELERMFNSVQDDVSTFNLVGAQMPDMGNWTIEKLVDMAGDAGQVESLAKGLKEMCRNIIQARRQGSASFTADNYALNIRSQSRTAMQKDQVEGVVRNLCKQLGLGEMETQMEILKCYAHTEADYFTYSRINAGG